MKKYFLFKVFGLLFLGFGLTIIFNSIQGITGYVVYGDVDLNKGYFIGAWFVLTGIILVIYRKKEVANERQQ